MEEEDDLIYRSTYIPWTIEGRQIGEFTDWFILLDGDNHFRFFFTVGELRALRGVLNLALDYAESI